MHIFTRQIGQSLAIGGSISVTVVAIRGAQVRLGIHAAPDVPILREEIVAKYAAKARGPGPAVRGACRQSQGHRARHRVHGAP